MHGEEVGAFQNPTVVAAYFVVTAVLFACGRLSAVAPVAAVEAHEGHEEHGMELEQAE